MSLRMSLKIVPPDGQQIEDGADDGADEGCQIVDRYRSLQRAQSSAASLFAKTGGAAKAAAEAEAAARAAKVAADAKAARGAKAATVALTALGGVLGSSWKNLLSKKPAAPLSPSKLVQSFLTSFKHGFGLSKESGLTPGMSAEEAFSVLDKDGSGAISVGEMSVMLTKGDSAQVLGEAYVQDLIDQVDQNGDGELQLGEFEIFWESFQASSAGLQRQVEEKERQVAEEMKARATTGIGSSWRRVEGIKPEFGVEISNKELAKALMARLRKNSTVDSVEFSQEEVKGFSLRGLKANAFIKVTLGRGDKGRNHYFVQAASCLHRHSHDGDKNHLPIAHNAFHLKRRGLSFERAGARGFADGRAEIADTMLEAEVNAARALPSTVGTPVQDVSEDAAVQSTRGTQSKAAKDPALLKPAGPRGNPMTNRHRAAFSPGENDEHRVRRLCAELERCDELSGWHSHQPALGADDEDRANFDASYVASYALFKGATKGGVSPATPERGLGGRAEGSLSRALDANRFAQAAKAVDVMMARLDEVETCFKPSRVSTAPTVLQMVESESDGPVQIPKGAPRDPLSVPLL